MASKLSIKKSLIEECKAAGTYKPHVERTIEVLTNILKRYEKVCKEWKADGEPFMVTEVNTKGEPYTKKDARIDIMNKLEDSALRYLTALGLTPKSLDVSETKSTSGKATISDFIRLAETKAGKL